MVNTNFDLWENEVECSLDEEIASPLASLRELQSATREELSALMPSVLDRAFKGEL